MTIFEDVAVSRPLLTPALRVLGTVSLTLLACLIVWAALSHLGPQPEPTDLPDWHGNVAVGQ